MRRDKIRRSIRIIGILTSFILPAVICEAETSSRERKTPRDVFSPRMDYDQWKPLGRGDPLKDDPTYDYVPPVLERVHYWIDPASRKPDSPNPESHKTEILLLGVSSKKPSTGSYIADSRKDVYDSFMEFVDGPKFSTYQKTRPPFKSDYYHQFPPSRNGLSQRNVYSKGNDQRIPYTILVPPPISISSPSSSQALPLTTLPDVMFSSPSKSTEAPKKTPQSAPKPTAYPFKNSYSDKPDVTIQSSNLIYSSSSHSSAGEWNTYSTDINRQKSTWKTTPPTNFVLSNANRIHHNYKDIQMSQKPMPESFIQIDMSLPQVSHKPLLESGSDHNINFIAAPSFGGNVEIMHKGQVSDDDMDISNTYVKIGKTEAQVHASDDVHIPIIAQPIDPPNMNNMIVFSHIKHPMNIKNLNYSPLTMQSILDMETMQPPPITMSPIFTQPSSFRIPKNTTNEEFNEVLPTVPTSVTEARSTLIKDGNVDSTTEFITTTSTALTTDPLFKHYKQPIEPLKGPMYLIIQGHSKVKTYGPNKSIHGISIEESNDISDGATDNEDVVINHLHNYSTTSEDDERFREGRSGKLQTLKHVIQTGLGAITSSELKDDTPIERRNDVQETEVKGSFEVLSGEVTSEKYHKGIVEAARKLKDFGKSLNR